mgnify:CR=1 FL=1
MTYGLKEPIGPHFRYFIGQLRTSAEHGKSSPQIIVNCPNDTGKPYDFKGAAEAGKWTVKTQTVAGETKERGAPFAELPFPSRVRLAAHVSNGLKSRIHPVVGRI